MRYFIAILTLFFMVSTASLALSKEPKAKFYDFSEQLIDGEVKRPTTLYTDARDAVKFERLLKLKKSFIPKLLLTAKEPIFR